MKYLMVTADYNDADYIKKLTEITDEELVKLTPLIEAIKNFKGYTVNTPKGCLCKTWSHRHNFPINGREDLGEKTPHQLYVETGLVDEDTLDLFMNDFMPYGENNAHSIKQIELLEVSDIKKLL